MGDYKFLIGFVFMTGCAGAEPTPMAPVAMAYAPSSAFEDSSVSDTQQKAMADEQKRAQATYDAQKKAVEDFQAQNEKIRAAYAQRQEELNNVYVRNEEERKQAQAEGEKKILEEIAACKKSAECTAEIVCRLVNDIKEWKQAIHDEERNPSGIVNMMRLHEYGQAIQEDERNIRINLDGTKFTVASLCKS